MTSPVCSGPSQTRWKPLRRPKRCVQTVHYFLDSRFKVDLEPPFLVQRHVSRPNLIDCSTIARFDANFAAIAAINSSGVAGFWVLVVISSPSLLRACRPTFRSFVHINEHIEPAQRKYGGRLPFIEADSAGTRATSLRVLPPCTRRSSPDRRPLFEPSSEEASDSEAPLASCASIPNAVDLRAIGAARPVRFMSRPVARLMP